MNQELAGLAAELYYGITLCFKAISLLLLFPIALFALFFLHSWGGTGADLNEPVQDWVEVSSGIAALSEFKNVSPLGIHTPESDSDGNSFYAYSVFKNVPYALADKDKQIEEVTISFRGRYNEVTFQREPQEFVGSDSIVWNPNVVFYNRNDFRDYNSDSVRKPHLLYWPFGMFGVACLVFCLSDLGLYLIRRKEFCLNALCSLFLLLFSGFWVWGFWTIGRQGNPVPLPRNYSDNAGELYELCRRNQDQLAEILRTHPQTALVKADFLPQTENVAEKLPKEEQLALPYGRELAQNYLNTLNTQLYPNRPQRRNLHYGHVFVGGGPLQDPGYVRINADLFNYLFYAPGFTLETMRDLNHKIQWTQLDENFFLGRYDDFISEMRNFSMFVAAVEVIYLFSIVLPCLLLLRVYLKSRATQSNAM